MILGYFIIRAAFGTLTDYVPDLAVKYVFDQDRTTKSADIACSAATPHEDACARTGGVRSPRQD